MKQITRLTGFVDRGCNLRLFLHFEDEETQEIEPITIVEIMNAILGPTLKWINVISKVTQLQDQLISRADNPPRDSEKETE